LFAGQLRLAGCKPNSPYKCELETWPLYVAVEKGYSKIVEYLSDFGANINEAICWGDRPLHVAAKKKHMDVCRVLLEKAARMNVKDIHHRIPLHYILSVENFEDSLFVWNHADFSLLNRADNGGVSPFMVAVRHWDARGDRGGLADLGASAFHYF